MLSYSTRPFLEPIEKLWIVYQLLTCLDKCHEQDVYHGDIKSENILVTSWNWVYLSDFAPFKPVYIPENDPSQFSFYFDTSQRRSCYVAPERFTAAGETVEGRFTAAMDIFSLGCVIAELFLEGAHIFSLAQLFKYRRGEYTPVLSGIENEFVREMVSTMISLDPDNRLSAAEHLQKWRHKLFPNYFYNFLHDFVSAVSSTNNYNSNGQKVKIQSLLDNRMVFIFQHFKDAALALGFEPSMDEIKWDLSQSIIPTTLELPGMRHVVTRNPNNLNLSKDDGALIVLAVVLSTVRNVSNSSLKIKGCDLILALGEMINDEAKLDRCLPYFLSLLDDESEIVQASAIRNMTELLGMITIITPLNGEIFSEYIFPKLDTILRSNPSKSVFVRTIYASCFPTLSTIASRFLEMSQVLKTSGMLDSYDPETENGARFGLVPFDLNRQGLLEKFEEHTIALLSDEDTSVRKALLKEIIPLCLFFGKQKTNDVILSHILTYLNDQDSSLKLQFFDCIIGLSPFIGPTGLEQYIQPLMLQALSDPEEYVTSKTFETYKAFSDLGLIKKGHIWDLLRIAVRYSVHPNPWIRNAAFAFISSSITWMSQAEIHCLLYPIVRPFLENDITDFSQSSIVSHAKPPLSRSVFNFGISWATKAQKSHFWKTAAKSSGVFTSDAIATLPRSEKDLKLSSEDEKWIQRLRETIVDDEDLWKIAVLREHLYRLAGALSLTQKPSSASKDKDFEREKNGNFANLVSVESLGISPEKYVFPNEDFDWVNNKNSDSLSNFEEIQTALRETATKPIDDAKRRSADITVGANGATVEQSPATIGTVITEVYGTVEQPFSSILPKGVDAADSPNDLRYATKKPIDLGGKYEFDPYVAKLLNSVNITHVRAEPTDFGPQVIPVTHSAQLHNLVTTTNRLPNWEPTGVLASQFSEHQAPINKIEISPDHSFFLSCSDDGTIKIWDCLRLEKNVINRSIHTYKCGPTKVKFICFMENSYTFATSCSNGTIEFIRIEVALTKATSQVRFKKFVPIRKYNLEPDEFATWMKHIKTTESSLLIIATTRSRVIGLDVNTLKEKFIFKCPLSHGIPSCFVVDEKKCWLLLGTFNGVLDLYDLRFSILVKTWTFENAAPIRRLQLRPKSLGVSFCMLGGTSKVEASIWDITSMKCEEVYSASANVDQSKSYRAISFEDTPSGRNKVKFPRVEDPSSRANSLLCMAVGIDSLREADNKRRHIHILTGGTDRKIRFWDINSVESCSVVSGLTSESGVPTFFRTFNNSAVKIIGERMTPNRPSPESAAKATRTPKPPRPSVVGSEQQELAKNHQASIVDVAILHKPYQMIVTADRAGVIKVFI